MKLRTDLSFFSTLVKCGSLSAAAQEFNVTPSAVSKWLAQLEERLGVRLIARNTRRFSLTQEGEIYLAEGQRIAPVGSTYGYDVVVRIGWWRQEARATYSEIHAELASQIRISASHVRYLYQHLYLHCWRATSGSTQTTWPGSPRLRTRSARKLFVTRTSRGRHGVAGLAL